MAKPRPFRVPSDDCEVTVGGETYTPHEGESVMLLPGLRVGETAAFQALISVQADLDALGPEEAAGRLGVIADAARIAAPVLSARLVSWDWTDDFGRPLPQPSEGPAAFVSLTFQELAYLAGVLVTGGNTEQSKNGSRPSPTTSLATARRKSRT